MPSITPIGAQAAVAKPVAPSSANPLTAGAVATSNPNSTSGLTMSSKISSLAELKKKAPDVYNQMMQGIGMEICREMQAHQERLKKLMREGQQQR